MAATLYRGKITDMTSQGVMVEIPTLAQDHQFGPCQVIGNDYEIGQNVIVSQIGEIKEDLIVIGPYSSEVFEDFVNGGDINNPVIIDPSISPDDAGSVTEAELDAVEAQAIAAQNTANNALAVGNAAQTSANTAQTSANHAQTTIDNYIAGVPGGGDTLIVRVDDFGAVGDGVADDTAASQAAIDACPPGGYIYYTPGKTYSHTGVAFLKSNIELIGYGATMTRPLGATVTVFVARPPAIGQPGPSHVKIRGFTFLGEAATNRAITALSAADSTDFIIEHCKMIQCQSSRNHTFDLGGCDGFTFRDCIWRGMTTETPVYSYNRAETIQMDVSKAGSTSYASIDGTYSGRVTTNVTIENCQFLPEKVGSITYPCPNPVGVHATAENQYFSGLIFRNNLVVDPSPDAVAATTTENQNVRGLIHAQQVKDWLIEGNRFIATAGVQKRILMIQSVSQGTLASNDPNTSVSDVGPYDPPMASQNIKFVNNHIEGFSAGRDGRSDSLAEGYLYFNGAVNGNVDGIVISGNTFLEVGNRSVHMYRASNVTISNNVHTNCYNLAYIATTTKLTMTGNTGNVSGFYIYITGSNTIAVTGNSFSSTQGESQGCIQFLTCTDVNVTGNTVFNTSTASQNGIALSAVSRFIVSGNMVRRNSAGAGYGVRIYGASEDGVMGPNTVFGVTPLYDNSSGKSSNYIVTPVAQPA